MEEGGEVAGVEEGRVSGAFWLGLIQWIQKVAR